MHRPPYSNTRRGRGGRGGRGGSRGHWGRGFRRFASADRFENDDDDRVANGHYLPQEIFSHFNPTVYNGGHKPLTTINGTMDKPDAIAYALVYTANQSHWMDDNTLFIKSHLDILPGYEDDKAILDSNHKEMDYDQMMEGITARLTETIRFGRYGIEDGPDVECFNEDDNITSLIVPGDWVEESFELPRAASVVTPSVAYTPDYHQPFAVYAGNGRNPDRTGFKFIAWFFVQKVELFAAKSAALARKMQSARWEADINHEWAVVKLQKIEKGEPDWRPEPRINRNNTAYTTNRAYTTNVLTEQPNGGGMHTTTECGCQEKEDTAKAGHAEQHGATQEAKEANGETTEANQEAKEEAKEVVKGEVKNKEEKEEANGETTEAAWKL